MLRDRDMVGFAYRKRIEGKKKFVSDSDIDEVIPDNGSGVWSSSKKPDRSDCGLTIYRSY